MHSPNMENVQNENKRLLSIKYTTMCVCIYIHTHAVQIHWKNNLQILDALQVNEVNIVLSISLFSL